jgi:hypothetical protein
MKQWYFHDSVLLSATENNTNSSSPYKIKLQNRKSLQVQVKKKSIWQNELSIIVDLQTDL